MNKNKPIKRLIAKEITVEKDLIIKYPAGFKYTIITDPETNQDYEPIPEWEVTGNDLSKHFREVDSSADFHNTENKS